MQNIRLKELRNSRGLTVRELGETIGIDFTIISAIENGRRKLNIDYAIRFADFFHVDVDFLLYRTKADAVNGFRDKLNSIFNEYELPIAGDVEAHKRLTCMKIILNLDPEMLDLALANLKVYSAKSDFKGGK